MLQAQPVFSESHKCPLRSQHPSFLCWDVESRLTGAVALFHSERRLAILGTIARRVIHGNRSYNPLSSHLWPLPQNSYPATPSQPPLSASPPLCRILEPRLHRWRATRRRIARQTRAIERNDFKATRYSTITQFSSASCSWKRAALKSFHPVPARSTSRRALSVGARLKPRSEKVSPYQPEKFESPENCWLWDGRRLKLRLYRECKQLSSSRFQWRAMI